MALKIIPEGGHYRTCNTLTCMSEDCVDGYLFPKDDTKTHSCQQNTNFTVIFCPGQYHPENTTNDDTTRSTNGSDLQDGDSVVVPDSTSTPMKPNMTAEGKQEVQQDVIIASTQSSATHGSVKVWIFSILGCVALAVGVVIITASRKKSYMEMIELKSPLIHRNTEDKVSLMVTSHDKQHRHNESDIDIQ